MNLEKLLNMCDNSVLDNLDVRFSRDAVSLQVKSNQKYPIVSTMNAFSDKEKSIFLEYEVVYMYADSDGRLLVELDY